jgi:hypothetical protein
MYFFGPPARFAAAVVAVFGLVAIFLGGPAGVLLFLAGVVIMTAHSGIELYLPQNQYRLYYRLLGLIRLGSKKSLDGFTRLEVKPWKGKHRVYSRSNRQVDVQDTRFVVYAVDDHHKDKIPLFISKDQQPAREKAREFAASINLGYRDDENQL